MILNLKRFGYLNTRKDRAEFTAVINQVLNEPEFLKPKMQKNGKQTYTLPPSDIEVKEILKNRDKIDEEADAKQQQEIQQAREAAKEAAE